MRRPRHRDSSEFPHAPLELLHPLAIPGGEIERIKILKEVRAGDGVRLWRLLWMVLSWTVEQNDDALWDPGQLEDFERDLLSHPDPALGQPAGLLAGYMAIGASPDPQGVAWACLCVAEWASGRGFRVTAAEFALTAALAWKSNARYACLAADLLWASGQSSRAEHWFLRTRRLAVWRADRVCESRALSRLAEIARWRSQVEQADDRLSRTLPVSDQQDLDCADEIAECALVGAADARCGGFAEKTR